MITFRLNTLSRDKMTGILSDESLATWVKANWKKVEEIEADEYELMHCCALLGRNCPVTRTSWVFIGANAQELARNWKAE